MSAAHVIWKFVNYFKVVRLLMLENSVEINYIHYINKCSKKINLKIVTVLTLSFRII